MVIGHKTRGFRRLGSSNDLPKMVLITSLVMQTKAVSRQHSSPGIVEVLECKDVLEDQSDLGLHSLLRPICPNI